MSVWCDTCGGSRVDVGAPSFSESHPLPVPCPTCGGSGLDPDRLERASKTYRRAWEAWWRNGLELARNGGLPADARAVVAAAITAYLRGEDDE